MIMVDDWCDDYDSTMPPSWSQPPIFTTRHSLPCGKFFLVSFLLMIIFLYYDDSESDYDSTSWLWLMIGAFRLLCNCCVILISAKYIILTHSFIPKIFLKLEISNEKQTTTSNFAGLGSSCRFWLMLWKLGYLHN